jgi:hypothetical protein
MRDRELLTVDVAAVVREMGERMPPSSTAGGASGRNTGRSSLA